MVVEGLPNGVIVDVDVCDKKVYFSGSLNDNVGRYDYKITTVGGNPDTVRTGYFIISDHSNISSALSDNEQSLMSVDIDNGYLRVTVNTDASYMEIFNISGILVERASVSKYSSIITKCLGGVYMVVLRNSGGEVVAKEKIRM